MKLTRYTDYALRVLIHLAVHEKELASIGRIASRYLISQNHLMKVVQDLSRAGFVETIRGRNGGLRLARRRLTSASWCATPKAASISWNAVVA
jgi:Rrf2 family nitric oxide-sensitive transcriptional repressor